MILFTHGVVGAALGRLVPGGPLASFAVGFASHFLLDAIPHQDYRLRSFRKGERDVMDNDMVVGRDFGIDLTKVGLDCLAGFAAATLLFGNGADSRETVVALSGAIGGVLPDALQFAYFKLRKEPLVSLQKFHMAIANDLENRPVFGRLTQAATLSVAIGLSLLIR